MRHSGHLKCTLASQQAAAQWLSSAALLCVISAVECVCGRLGSRAKSMCRRRGRTVAGEPAPARASSLSAATYHTFTAGPTCSVPYSAAACQAQVALSLQAGEGEGRAGQRQGPTGGSPGSTYEAQLPAAAAASAGSRRHSPSSMLVVSFRRSPAAHKPATIVLPLT